MQGVSRGVRTTLDCLQPRRSRLCWHPLMLTTKAFQIAGKNGTTIPRHTNRKQQLPADFCWCAAVTLFLPSIFFWNHWYPRYSSDSTCCQTLILLTPHILIHYCFKGNFGQIILRFKVTGGYKTLSTLKGLFQAKLYVNKMCGIHKQARATVYYKQGP